MVWAWSVSLHKHESPSVHAHTLSVVTSCAHTEMQAHAACGRSICVCMCVRVRAGVHGHNCQHTRTRQVCFLVPIRTLPPRRQCSSKDAGLKSASATQCFGTACSACYDRKIVRCASAGREFPEAQLDVRITLHVDQMKQGGGNRFVSVQGGGRYNNKPAASLLAVVFEQPYPRPALSPLRVPLLLRFAVAC